MRLFTQPVVSITDTHIFARLTSPNTQLLVYDMSYAAADEVERLLAKDGRDL